MDPQGVTESAGRAGEIAAIWGNAGVFGDATVPWNFLSDAAVPTKSVLSVCGNRSARKNP